MRGGESVTLPPDTLGWPIPAHDAFCARWKQLIQQNVPWNLARAGAEADVRRDFEWGTGCAKQGSLL